MELICPCGNLRGPRRKGKLMKKLTSIIAIILACSMFGGCSNTTNGDSTSKDSPASTVESNTSEELTIEQKTQMLLEEIEFPSMVNVKADNLETYYGFTKDDVAEYSSYICGSGAMPDEFGIFIAASDEAAEKIKDALNKRIESQKATYGDYTPNEMYKFDDCFVSVNGTTVIYAICADNNKAKELFG